MAISEVQVSLRLPKDLIERAEAIAPLVAALPEYQALRISRATVIRLALLEGLDALEARVAPKRKNGSRKR
jgi:hypothetical protein